VDQPEAGQPKPQEAIVADVDAESFEHLDVATDRAGVTAQDLGEVFLGKESSLVAGLFAEASDAVAP